MKRSKRKRNRPVKKTLKREDRLRVAKPWISKYNGSNLLRGYRRKFNVDVICALAELQMLGVKLDNTYIEDVKRSERARLESIKARKQRRYEECDLIESDETFQYIMGYTSGGVPYGIRWDEEMDIGIEEDYDEDDILF